MDRKRVQHNEFAGRQLFQQETLWQKLIFLNLSIFSVFCVQEHPKTSIRLRHLKFLVLQGHKIVVVQDSDGRIFRQDTNA
jgi:hypothetical protein